MIAANHKQLRVRIHPVHDPDEAFQRRDDSPLFDVVIGHVADADLPGTDPMPVCAALFPHDPDEFDDIENASDGPRFRYLGL